MKPIQWIFALQIFGLIMHFLLAAALVVIGYFDFLGLGPLANSTAQLVKTLAAAQSSSGGVDPLTSQIATETTNAASVLLSVLKTLSVSAIVTFVIHVISFRRQKSSRE